MYRRIGKRSMDVMIAAGALVVLLPVLLVIWAAVLLALGPPAFFRQTRPGRHGEPFTIFKFRTMRPPAGANVRVEEDAQRLTRFGSFLRRTSLDELPELWNVLRGDMSLVGPRPLLMEYLPRYSPRQARRHEVRPGITGWAQVNGRNNLSWEEKFEHDVWYVDHLSFALDVRILWLTLKSVVRGEAISAPGHATMPEFRGSAHE